MNPEHMAESGHRITRPEFPDYRELFRESDIKSAVAFLIFHFPFQYVVAFPELTDFNLFRGNGEAFGVLPCRSSRNCFTHRVIVERPTSIALAASATV